MNDIYCLKIEVDTLSQLELIDLILDVEHNTISDSWALEMDYDDNVGDCPIFYISYLINILEDKYDDLEKIGITRNMISIWRCVIGYQELFMEYWPEEMKLIASAGIRFRLLCRVMDEDEREMPHFNKFSEPNC